jgi:nicotinate-nucleotide--dimethylbenzimidazole phosphoribosyltransferase
VIDRLIAAVTPVDPAAEAAWARQDSLAKPPRSLGRLEELSVRLAAIGRSTRLRVPASPAVVVAAADHGVHGPRVSDWPQAVTQAMIAAIASGRASINAIARASGAAVTVVDVGSVSTGPLPSGVIDRRVRAGTRDITVEPAMSIDECTAAICAGADVTAQLIDAGVDLVATGEVGIGNTTASAALIAVFTGLDAGKVTGDGANASDVRTPDKIRVVREAVDRHGADRDPLTTLASLGGLEHAALVGVMLAAAAARVPVVIDGVITGAAALAATALCPDLAGYLVAGHTSAEPGGQAVLDALDQTGVLDLGMKLGEGSGAALAIPVIQAAAQVLTEVATLDEVVNGG